MPGMLRMRSVGSMAGQSVAGGLVWSCPMASLDVGIEAHLPAAAGLGFSIPMTDATSVEIVGIMPGIARVMEDAEDAGEISQSSVYFFLFFEMLQ